MHSGKEALCGGGGDIVIKRGRVNIGDLLIELSLAQADFPDALELLLEVIFTKHGAVVFQTLVIHCKSLDGERLDNAGGPLAELHRSFRVHLVADGNNGGEIIVLGVVGFLVGGSYMKISNN